jgi:hypothetical protein
MGFSDEAREIARKKQAEQQIRREETVTERIRRHMDFVSKEFLIPPCRDKLAQWFDKVGMLPYPPLGSGELKRRVRKGYGSDPDESYRNDPYESYVELIWRFDGYDYRAECYPYGPADWLKIDIKVEGKWFPAGTKEAIGRALLQEGEPPPPPPPTRWS